MLNFIVSGVRGLNKAPFNRFREKGLVLDKDDVTQVKEVFKWIMQGLVAKELKGISVVTKVENIQL